MKSEKKLKLIFLIFIIIIFALSSINLVYADFTPEDFNNNISISGTGPDNVKTVGGKVVALIQVVGTIVAVGMLMVLGIKYMMGSAEERAAYKKTLFPYFIGAVLIFAAASLAQVIYNWAIAIK